MGGVGEGRIVKKKMLFDLLEPEEKIYATVTIKFLESIQNIKPSQKPVPINKNLV